MDATDYQNDSDELCLGKNDAQKCECLKIPNSTTDPASALPGKPHHLHSQRHGRVRAGDEYHF